MRLGTALLLLAAGCQGRLIAWYDPVTGPDGHRAWAIGCYSANICYQLAGRCCPNGYTSLDTNQSTEASSEGRAVGQYARTSSRTETVTTMLIACKSAP